MSSVSDVAQGVASVSLKAGEKAPKAQGDDDGGLSAEQLAEIEANYNLIRSVGEECQSEKELRNLVTKKAGNFRLYDGFEPSGRMHIAQGVFKAMNVNRCTAAGGTFVFWVADWFALMNDKMGGDLDKIKVVGEYLIEVWKAAGMDMSGDRVVFRWASEDITNNAEKYWTQMLDVARRFSLARIMKCCQIMGRLENRLTAAQILYPLMQCTDIFFLRANVCQLGVDQRKVNMLAREYCDAAGIKLKPVILSHHMLYGLKAGQAKMSKSDPDSAIFMEDTAEDVERKMMNAYCPVSKEEAASATASVKTEGESMSLVEDELKNPCLDYLEYIIFRPPNATFEAGGETYADFASAKEALLTGKMSPQELKAGLAKAVNLLLQPVRDHFEGNARAKELLAKVRSYKRGAAAAPAKASKAIPRGAYAGDKPRFVVHAPSPPLTAWTPLGTALTLLQQLRSKPSDDHQSILFLPDLSALVLNSFGRDKKTKPLKVIRASFNVLVNAMKALDAPLMEGVTVLLQSQLMLASPSSYWISVINAGRKFQLHDLCKTISPNEEVAKAGPVVAALMHVGDVLALGADTLATTATTKHHHELVKKYINMLPEGSTSGFFNGAAEPKMIVVDDVSSALKQEKDNNAFDPDECLWIMDDPVMGDPQRKLKKKAFCEPGNVAFNPPVVFAEHMIFAVGSELIIQRKPENGGDVTYTSSEQLRADFASEKLHPGDLKPAVAKAVLSFYNALKNKLGKKNSDVKAIKAYQKKLKKMK